MDFTVKKLVLNALAVVCEDLHHGGFLPSVFKHYGVFLVRDNIVLIRGKLLQIVASKGEIGLALGMTYLVKGDDL